VSSAAPPDDPAARRSGDGAARTTAAAAIAGASAIAGLTAVCLLISAGAASAVPSPGPGTWSRLGLLAALLGVGSDVSATIRGGPIVPGLSLEGSFRWRVVPMLLTIGVLWLAAWGGRRAADAWPGGGAARTAGVAAAAAAIPAAALAALAAAAAGEVSVGSPTIRVRLGAEPGDAALAAAVLIAGGAAAGAFLRSSRGRTAAALRGGIVGYGWALGSSIVGVALIAALEPAATRAYVDGLIGMGTGGAVLFASHVLALPAQSALLLAPAAGACLRAAGETPIVTLCPWRVTTSGPAVLVTGTSALTPWVWLLSAVPALAAATGGRAAALAADRSRPIVVGALAGIAFAGFAVAGAWFAAPRFVGELPLLAASDVSLAPDLGAMSLRCLGWGIAGGAVGGWIAGAGGPARQPPSRTSV
jgi:hypothetical protein